MSSLSSSSRMSRNGSLNRFVVIALSNVNSNEGNKNMLHNNAMTRVNEIRYPRASVPPKDDRIKMANPKNSTTDEYSILYPVSLRASSTDTLIFQLFHLNCSLYRERKCIALSTEIPRAILNIRIVDGLMDMPRYPISAAVSRRGMRFGIKDMKIILNEENNNAIRNEMIIRARIRLDNRFRTR